MGGGGGGSSRMGGANAAPRQTQQVSIPSDVSSLVFFNVLYVICYNSS